jgi:hypothetical protein
VALLSDLVSRVRLELGDQGKEFTFTAIGDGVTKEFYLNNKPVDAYTLTVTVTQEYIPAPVGYKLEVDQGIVRFQNPIANGATLTVHGTAYRYFSDADIERFIDTAVTQHLHERTDAYGSRMSIGAIQSVEEYPVAILSTIEALWALATDASFDINITAPDGVVIPRSQRWQQLTSMIQQRQDQYKQLCSALNIGLWRIQMGTLRRVSRHTNKLVPVYMAQEHDDSRKPERVYLPNDLNGRQVFPTTVQAYDLVLYQGDSFTQDFVLGASVTGLVFKSEMRTYPNSPARYASFTVTIIDAATGRIRITLTQSATKYLPVRLFWDLQATSTTDATFQKTFLRGQVFVTQQVSVD